MALNILKNTAGDSIFELSGTGESQVFTIQPVSVQTQALFVINGDSGTVDILQRIKGETEFRDLQKIDLSTSQGNMLNNWAISDGIEYKIIYTAVTNLSIGINKIKQEN